MSDAEHYATARVLELVADMGRDRGFRHGWKVAVAGELGLCPTFLSKLLNGRRTITVDRAVRLAGRLGIDPASFIDSAGPSPAAVRAGPAGPSSAVARAVTALLALDPATRRKVIAFVEDLDGEPSPARAATPRVRVEGPEHEGRCRSSTGDGSGEA